MNLQAITKLARQAAYDEPTKKKYKSAAMSYLRKLAKQLELPKDSYDIRYNAGGIAVAGEATLHHENFYFQISEFGYWRPCKGRKDYTGGQNHPFDRDDYNHQKIVNAIVLELNLVGK